MPLLTSRRPLGVIAGDRQALQLQLESGDSQPLHSIMGLQRRCFDLRLVARILALALVRPAQPKLHEAALPPVVQALQQAPRLLAAALKFAALK